MSEPYEEAYIRDLKAEELLMQRPVCDECGNHIQDEYYFQLGDKKICPKCIEDFLVYID